ncbi:WAT1-related protein [Drosera capensis]
MYPWVMRALPFAVMISEECLAVGLSTLSKSAMSKGMNRYVYIFYSNALAAVILFPSLFINRRDRPPLSWLLMVKFFLLSLVGITVMQNLIYTGLNYSTTTLASAMTITVIPSFTFVLSVIFGMEKLDPSNLRGLIKILGTLVSIAGGLIVVFYKGPVIIQAASELLSLIFMSEFSVDKTGSFDTSVAASNWILGSIFLAGGSVCFSIWNVSQAATLKGYPSGVTIVFFYCLFGAIQTAVVALVVVRDFSSWKFDLGIEYVTVFYSAIIGNVTIYNADTWCIKVKGPVFVAMFKPIGIAISAITGAIFLGSSLYLGCIIGAVVIVTGFYAVIWSQSKDNKVDIHINEAEELPLGSERTPLLPE